MEGAVGSILETSMDLLRVDKLAFPPLLLMFDDHSGKVKKLSCKREGQKKKSHCDSPGTSPTRERDVIRGNSFEKETFAFQRTGKQKEPGSNCDKSCFPLRRSLKKKASYPLRFIERESASDSSSESVSEVLEGEGLVPRLVKRKNITRRSSSPCTVKTQTVSPLAKPVDLADNVSSLHIIQNYNRTIHTPPNQWGDPSVSAQESSALSRPFSLALKSTTGTELLTQDEKKLKSFPTVSLMSANNKSSSKALERTSPTRSSQSSPVSIGGESSWDEAEGNHTTLVNPSPTAFDSTVPSPTYSSPIQPQSRNAAVHSRFHKKTSAPCVMTISDASGEVQQTHYFSPPPHLRDNQTSASSSESDITPVDETDSILSPPSLDSMGSQSESNGSDLVRGHAQRENFRSRLGSGVKDMKIVVLGASGVGKTALTVKFLTKRFIGDYDSNKEEVYRYKTHLGGRLSVLHIRDTVTPAPSTRRTDSGNADKTGKSSEDKTLLKMKWADALMIVCSATDRRSFQHAADLVQRYRTHSSSSRSHDSPPIVLVVNKCDLTHDRVIEEHELAVFAHEKAVHVVQTSARESYNSVLAAFQEVCTSVPTNSSSGHGKGVGTATAEKLKSLFSFNLSKRPQISLRSNSKSQRSSEKKRSEGRSRSNSAAAVLTAAATAAVRKYHQKSESFSGSELQDRFQGGRQERRSTVTGMSSRSRNLYIGRKGEEGLEMVSETECRTSDEGSTRRISDCSAQSSKLSSTVSMEWKSERSLTEEKKRKPRVVDANLLSPDELPGMRSRLCSF